MIPLPAYLDARRVIWTLVPLAGLQVFYFLMDASWQGIVLGSAVFVVTYLGGSMVMTFFRRRRIVRLNAEIAALPPDVVAAIEAGIAASERKAGE